jgi:hypothetical protein
MASQVRIRKPLRKMTLTLASGASGDAGDVVGAVVGTHTVNEISAATNMKTLGKAVEDFSYANGDRAVQVELFDKADLEYATNDTASGAIAIATDFLGKAYWKDGQTLTKLTDDGNGVNYAFAGIVYDVDAIDGVGIKPVSTELGELLS